MNYRLVFCLVCLLAIVGTVSADTLLVYSTMDAYTIYGQDNDRDWSQLNAGTGDYKGGSGSDNYQLTLTKLKTTATSNKFGSMGRGYQSYNTSTIGTGTITSGTLRYKLYGSSTIKTLGLPENISLVSVTPTNPLLLTDWVHDYQSVGTTEYAPQINWSSIGSNQNINFTLNTDGLAYINKTGLTVFATRSSDEIAGSFAGTWAASKENTLIAYGKKYGGDGPFLEITYTTGGGGSAPVASFTCTKNFLRIPNSVTCTDSSINTPTSWSWNMGDGSAAKTTQNVTYQYLKRGAWGITLNATNAIGSNVTPSATNMKVVGYENV